MIISEFPIKIPDIKYVKVKLRYKYDKESENISNTKRR